MVSISEFSSQILLQWVLDDTILLYTCVPPLVGSLCKEERARLNNLSVKWPVPFLSNNIKGDAKLWQWAYQVVYTRGFEANNGSGDF